MRIDLPFCNLKTCRYCFDGNCIEKNRYDTCEYAILKDAQPAIEAVPVVHGKWILEANKENVNYRWNVVAECSKCHHELGEIWAGFFPGVPDSIAKDVALQYAGNVKLGNFCSNCGADLRKK